MARGVWGSRRMSKKKKKRTGAGSAPQEPQAEEIRTDAEASAGGDPGRPVRRSILSNPVVSKLLDLYETVAMGIGGGLFAAMIAHWFHLPGIVEWVIGVLVMIAVLLSRTVFSNDMGEIVADARAQAETERLKDEEEIAAGNYEGVPRILQSLMPLPDEAERRRDAAEAERQRQLLDDLRRKNKRRRKKETADGESGDDSNGRSTDDDRPEGAETESHS